MSAQMNQIATQLQTLLDGIAIVNDGDTITADHHNSLRAAISLIASSLPKTVAGQSDPGVGWQDYAAGAGLFIDVDTRAAGFTATPIYITCLGGTSGHWELTGGGAVYTPTPTGFRIYIRRSAGTKLTPADATAAGWHVKWIGIQARQGA
jgi:hypothetical protein